MQSDVAAAKPRLEPSELKKRLEAAFGPFDVYSGNLLNSNHDRGSIFSASPIINGIGIGGGGGGSGGISQPSLSSTSCGVESLRVASTASTVNGSLSSAAVEQQVKVNGTTIKIKRNGERVNGASTTAIATVTADATESPPPPPEKKARLEELLQHFEDVAPLISPVRTITPPEKQQKSDGPPLPTTYTNPHCRLNLSLLTPKHRQLLETKLAERRRQSTAVPVPTVDKQHPKELKANHPHPHPTAATNGELMARSMPALRASVEEPPVGSKSAVEYYKDIARKIKREHADKEKDRIRKTFSYLEATVYYTLSAASMCSPTTTSPKESTPSSSRQNPEALILSIQKFIKDTASNFIGSRSESIHLNYFRDRIRILTHALNACLEYQLYHLKSEQALKNHETLAQYEREAAAAASTATVAVGGSSTSTNDTISQDATRMPSPAPSTPSTTSSRSASAMKEMVMVPADIHSLQSQQHSIVGHLLLAHKHWREAFEGMSAENGEFINHLNKLCGHLQVDSSLRELALFLFTAVPWMTKQYELQLRAKK